MQEWGNGKARGIHASPPTGKDQRTFHLEEWKWEWMRPAGIDPAVGDTHLRILGTVKFPRIEGGKLGH